MARCARLRKPTVVWDLRKPIRVRARNVRRPLARWKQGTTLAASSEVPVKQCDVSGWLVMVWLRCFGPGATQFPGNDIADPDEQ